MMPALARERCSMSSRMHMERTLGLTASVREAGAVFLARGDDGDRGQNYNLIISFYVMWFREQIRSQAGS